MSKRYELLSKANRSDELFAPLEDSPATGRRESWEDPNEALVERPRTLREARAEEHAAEPAPREETPQQAAQPRALMRTNALPPRISQPEVAGWRNSLAEVLHNPAVEDCSSLGVCAVDSGSDGSALTAAVAEWMSQRVSSPALLIEATLRRSKLARVFGVGEKPGLHEALFDPSFSDSTPVRQTPLENLLLLPTGKPFSRSRSRQAGGLLLELHGSLRRHYAQTLVQLPPANDPRFKLIPAVALTDAVVLTVDPKVTGLRRIQSAMSVLRAAQIHVVGCLIDRPSRDGAPPTMETMVPATNFPAMRV